ncbi:SUMO-activating enzyme subunit 2 [Galdieria sulphuraria]|nr:SUMO-activating enzyme subunit 2 [Galdieria sulphuraria]
MDDECHSHADPSNIYKGAEHCFSSCQIVEKIRHSKILLIGVGGVGCEVLKNLVFSGFVNIHLVDLDTISVSNLNRQFLFRSEDVGKWKAVVAKDRITKLCPWSQITVSVENIRSKEFPLEFFKQFAAVICALDNHKARLYVNEVCAFAQVPLFETGSTGYQGQVTPILAGSTECYNCEPKPQQTEHIAVCTIRHRPESVEHCIVWAMYLFDVLFGNLEDSNPLSDEKEYKVSHLAREWTFEDGARKTSTEQEWENMTCERVVNKFFIEDLQFVESLKKDTLSSLSILNIPTQEQLRRYLLNVDTKYSVEDLKLEEQNPHQLVWTCDKAYEVLIFCLKQLLRRWKESKSALTFDENDTISLAFVTAASTVRASAFDIVAKNSFDVRGIAGRIIPALSITNAVIGGIVVFQLLRFLSGTCMKDLCNARLSQVSRPRPRYLDEVIITPEFIRPPVAECIICHQLLLVTCDARNVTVRQFIEDGLKKQMNMEPFSVATDVGYIIYDSEQDCEVPVEAQRIDKSTIAQLQVEEQPLSILDESGVYYRGWIRHQCDVSLSIERIFSFGDD